MIKELIIGVDIGSGGGDTSAARTSAVLSVIPRTYQRAVVLIPLAHNGEFDYNDIVKGFWEWIKSLLLNFSG